MVLINLRINNSLRKKRCGCFVSDVYQNDTRKVFIRNGCQSLLNFIVIVMKYIYCIQLSRYISFYLFYQNIPKIEIPYFVLYLSFVKNGAEISIELIITKKNI